jgi:hypothetical protein
MGETNTYTAKYTRSEEAGNTTARATSFDNQNTSSYDQSVTYGYSFTASLDPGDTSILVTLFQTMAKQILWRCSNDDGSLSTYYSDVAVPFADTTPSVAMLLDVSHLYQDYFVVQNTQLTKAGDIAIKGGVGNGNAMSSGNKVIVSGAGKGQTGGASSNQYISVLKTERYSLILTALGEMFIVSTSSLLSPEPEIWWSTDSAISRLTDNPVTGQTSGSARLYITDRGQIRVEADNMFTRQLTSPYNETTCNPITRVCTRNTFTLVWSNIPKHLNYRAGLHRGVGYTLVLQEMDTNIESKKIPDLVLYDGGGSTVWCARNIACEHPRPQGYKFPETYGLPVDVPTSTYERTPDDSSYMHNWLDDSFTYIESKSLRSENTSCGPILVSGQGMVSHNGRFRAILDWSGNLIIKDGVRTMWQSVSGNIPYMTPPYELRLSNKGQIYIVDSLNMIVMMTPGVNRTVDSTISLGENGLFSVNYTGTSNMIWSSFTVAHPLISEVSIFKKKTYMCNSECKQCLDKLTSPITKIYNDGTFYTRRPPGFSSDVPLLSPSGNFSITIRNGSVAMNFNGTSKLIFDSSNVTDVYWFGNSTNYVTLDLDGLVNAWTEGVQDRSFWFNTREVKGVYPYTMEVTDEGVLQVTDVRNSTIWSFKWQDEVEPEVVPWMQEYVVGWYNISSVFNQYTVKDLLLNSTSGVLHLVNTTGVFMNSSLVPVSGCVNSTLSKTNCTEAPKWKYDQTTMQLSTNNTCLTLGSNSELTVKACDKFDKQQTWKRQEVEVRVPQSYSRIQTISQCKVVAIQGKEESYGFMEEKLVSQSNPLLCLSNNHTNVVFEYCSRTNATWSFNEVGATLTLKDAGTLTDRGTVEAYALLAAQSLYYGDFCVSETTEATTEYYVFDSVNPELALEVQASGPAFMLTKWNSNEKQKLCSNGRGRLRLCMNTNLCMTARGGVARCSYAESVTYTVDKVYTQIKNVLGTCATIEAAGKNSSTVRGEACDSTGVSQNWAIFKSKPEYKITSLSTSHGRNWIEEGETVWSASGTIGWTLVQCGIQSTSTGRFALNDNGRCNANSNNRPFRLVIQTDGNLVIYARNGAVISALASNTSPSTHRRVVVNSAGSLVLWIEGEREYYFVTA